MNYQKGAIVLGILLIATLAIFAFIPKEQVKGDFTEKDAINYVKSELANDFKGQDGRFEVVSIKPERDIWVVDAKITLNTGDPCCPAVYLRRYEMYPTPVHRQETLLSECASANRGVIAYEEEAWVASCKDANVKVFAINSSAVAARFFGPKEIADAKKCGSSCTRMQSLAATLESGEYWIVDWTTGQRGTLAVVTKYGQNAGSRPY